MYYIQSDFDGKFKTVSVFPTYFKALEYVREAVYIYNIPFSSLRIVHKGMVLTLNEKSLRSVFK